MHNTHKSTVNNQLLGKNPIILKSWNAIFVVVVVIVVLNLLTQFRQHTNLCWFLRRKKMCAIIDCNVVFKASKRLDRDTRCVITCVKMRMYTVWCSFKFCWWNVMNSCVTINFLVWNKLFFCLIEFWERNNPAHFVGFSNLALFFNSVVCVCVWIFGERQKQKQITRKLKHPKVMPDRLSTYAIHIFDCHHRKDDWNSQPI